MPNEIIDAAFEEREEIELHRLVERVPFERLVALKMAEIRDQFKKAIDQGVEDIGSLEVKIECSGPVLNGELKIEFKIGSAYGRTGQVVSHGLEPALKEFFRRKGFDMRNNALLLSQHNDTART